MRIIYKIIFVLLFPVTILGQNFPKNSILTSDSDTAFWLRYQEKILKNISPTKPFSHEDIFHLRLIYQGQLLSNVIDLWQNKDSIYHLELILYTKEIVPEGEMPTNRYYFEKVTYDSLKARNLFGFYLSNQISSIPTDKLISSWSKGCDGDEYIFETLENGLYSYKQYWTPSSHKSLLEGSLLNSFIEKFNELLETEKLKKEFTNRIPFECYNTGGPLTACKILTKKQKREFRKERKIE